MLFSNHVSASVLYSQPSANCTSQGNNLYVIITDYLAGSLSSIDINSVYNNEQFSLYINKRNLQTNAYIAGAYMTCNIGSPTHCIISANPVSDFTSLESGFKYEIYPSGGFGMSYYKDCSSNLPSMTINGNLPIPDDILSFFNPVNLQRFDSASDVLFMFDYSNEHNLYNFLKLNLYQAELNATTSYSYFIESTSSSIFPTLSNLSDGNYFASAYLYNSNSSSILLSNNLVHFIMGSSTPIIETINASSTDFGIFGNAVVDAFKWLFLPNESVKLQYNATVDNLKTKVPFSFFYASKNALDSINIASTTKLSTKVDISLSGHEYTIFDMANTKEALGNDNFNLLYNLVKYSMWFSLLIFYSLRITRMFTANS